MIFLRGMLKSGERPLFTFSGTIKRVKRRTPPAPQPASRSCRFGIGARAGRVAGKSRRDRSRHCAGAGHPCRLRKSRARLARLRVAAGAGVLLEFDLPADQDRPRLDPADHLHLGALADRGAVPARSSCTLRGIRIPTDMKAWKLFAFQQTINSTIPFLMITWAQQYRAGVEHGGAGLDHADLRVRHHLGDHAARAGHAAEARRRGAGPGRNGRDHRPRRLVQASATTFSPNC